ncbi:hypothetical protein ACNR9Q_04875 [Maribacter sp. X9]|uniref:hypothetical protein n=1 Tax=Maribacter sp. X9 TaxID=3402159 RepID=UPI003AF39DBA
MKKIILCLFALLIISCNNQDPEDNSNAETQIELVTGINIKDSFDAPPTRLGNPNIKNNDEFTAFPNPPIGTLFLSSNYVISDVWIVPANADKIFQQVDFNRILISDLYSENEINSKSNLKFIDQGSSTLSLNLETLDVGYYKVFVKIEDTIYWENIFASNGSQSIEELIEFWN